MEGFIRHNQSYDGKIEASRKLVWWKHSFQDLATLIPNITIFTNVSKMSWITPDEHNPSGGHWEEHGRIHINALKLCAVFLGILIYCQVKL